MSIEHRKPLVIGHEFITVAVEEGAQEALRMFFIKHRDELDALLAQFDLETAEIEIPDFRRLVWQTPRCRECSSDGPAHEPTDPDCVEHEPTDIES